MSARFALFWCPDTSSSLWRWGCGWLGRDAASGVECQQDDRAAALTAEPRRYGFHATLKPPFRMQAGKRRSELMRAVESFAAAREPFSAPPLQLANLGGFLALVLSGPSPRLDRLAADCVRSFDAYRALPDAAELAKRRAHGLDSIEEANLRAWGYPYVMDRFRFHLTLTGQTGEEPELEASLRLETAAFCAEPLWIDALAVFEQPEADQPFLLKARFAFKG